ncbi:MAG TPA: hypothetical protein VGC34_03825, partial [Steroidobacteraceae bacterium]
MKQLYSELQWLPGAAADFSQRLKAVAQSTQACGLDLQRLAQHALDLNQLTKLSKVVGALRARSSPDDPLLHPLTPFRLAILSNSTTDLIVPALLASAVRHGVCLEIIQPAYDQVAQEALNPDSEVNRSKPDAVLLSLDYR